jgi:mono/diheme cytochrome c family protein
MGEIWAPNLTADRDTGIGEFTDADLARLLRNGIRRDGRYAATMPRFGRLGDADVAALIGFLRSADPLLAPVSHSVPRLGLGVAGTLALAFAAGVDIRGEPHVDMPPRGRTSVYGRYLATAVYACVDCHTEGFTTTEEKLRSAALLAGGQFHRTPNGETIYSTNLTPDPETGLAVRTAADLARLLTTGVGGDRLVVRSPMPVFRAIDDDEAEALFAFLRSVPPVARRNAGPPREKPTPDAAPERLFASLGCDVCHGARPPRWALLKQAARWPVAEIAAFVRHPETRDPQTQMPTYAAVLDEAAALRLATWISATDGNTRP